MLPPRHRLVTAHAIACSLALIAAIANAQSRATLVVHAFTVAKGVPRGDQWEGDAVWKLQSHTIFRLKAKSSKYFDVVTEVANEANGKVYTLDVEILYWCDTFNTCPRLLPETSAGGFSAEGKIHYWLTDQSGNKIFEYTEVFARGPGLRVNYPPVPMIPPDDPAQDGVYLSDFAKPLANKLLKRLKQASVF